MFRVIWSFLTSKVGGIVISAALVGVVFYGVYHAGQLDTKADAQKTVDAIQKKYDAIVAERTQWQDALAKAVKDAKDGQQTIIDDIRAKLDKYQNQKPKVIQVTKYVTVKDDANCTINNGFVELYNGTLQASPISGSGRPDASAASGVNLSTVAAVAASNNAECDERGKVIQAWQEWYTRNSVLFKQIEDKSK